MRDKTGNKCECCKSDGKRVATDTTIGGFPFDIFTCRVCKGPVYKNISFKKDPIRFKRYARGGALKVAEAMAARGLCV